MCFALPHLLLLPDSSPPKLPLSHRLLPPLKTGRRLEISSFLLVQELIWGLESSLSTQKSRICSASSSLVRRVLLGLNPSAFSAASSPAEFLLLCRRLLPPARLGFAC
ncbi:hypothetical protein SLEP1_g18911 [Rubroshorea leprosula]|uniref:Uncharacterized protein n=1 Tax=Rubroshorea leprosula TaxID=152421 RepID=A0AAV5J9P9_9ROSI|nr:hypothetical protein SLEP1_g18911 [Rubroshorea leprosula]